MTEASSESAYQQGAIWRKWDLHIHTPASFHWKGGDQLSRMDDAAKDSVMRELLSAVNKTDISVFAIQDYFTFDGFIELRKFIKKNNVKLDKTIFPGIELRIECPTDYRLNIHCIFNDSVTNQQLSDFKTTLKLRVTNKSLSDESLIEYARSLGSDKLKSHGYKKEDIQTSDELAFTAGCKTAEITMSSFREAMKSMDKENLLVMLPFETSDGLEALNWEDHPAASTEFMKIANIFESRDSNYINLFHGITTPKNEGFIENFIFALGGEAKLATSGSDAHKFSDYGIYPSNKITWIKADPTFRGLIQATNEPASRCFIGKIPPKLDLVNSSKTKFVRTLSIHQKTSSSTIEKWFDCDINFNPDLVAIIGNKGSGKSALADIVARLGNTKQINNFSFLTNKRFRDPKLGRASHFEGVLTWESGDTDIATLDTNPLESSVEKIKYIPQTFLESICNESTVSEGSQFQKEIKKVIFSHTPDKEKFGKNTLDDLLEYKTEEVISSIESNRNEIKDINRDIVELEINLEPEYLNGLTSKLEEKEKELMAHISTRPSEVTKPSDSDTPEKKDLRNKIEIKIKESDAKNEEITKLIDEKSLISEKLVLLEKFKRRLDNITSEINSFKSDSEDSLKLLDINLDSVFSFKSDNKPLINLESKLEVRKEQISVELDGDLENSLVSSYTQTTRELSELYDSLDLPNQQYQQYINTKKTWDQVYQNLVGDITIEGSKSFLEAKITEIGQMPDKLKTLRNVRLRLLGEVFNKLKLIEKTYKAVFSPVQLLIESSKLVQSELQLSFYAGLSNIDFTERFFDIVGHGSIGTFYGVEEGNKIVGELLDKRELNTLWGIKRFVTEVNKRILFDYRSNKKALENADNQLKRGHTRVELYDSIYCLEYIKPKYSLRLANKDIQTLSPGQRGTLLLIFYLLVDNEKIPLVIDQPEENLDNQTVYKLLVPIIKDAKKNRQIIMVTHNANLAVVCDAEQIIHAEFDRDAGNKIVYTCGSIESEHINKLLLDVLEGTRPAFGNREAKYYSQ